MSNSDAVREAAATGSLTIADLGGPEKQAGLLEELADSDLLTLVLDVIANSFHEGDTAEPLVAAAAREAVEASSNPTVTADALEVILTTPALVAAIGADLATALLVKAAPPDGSAAPREVLLAADSLEAATRLVLGDWATPWRLFTVLESLRPDQPSVYLRSGCRCIVSCIERWPEASGLQQQLLQLVGADPAAGPSRAARVEEALESDVAVALARVSILEALRATEEAEVVGHLDEVATLLAAVTSLDDHRVDAPIAVAIAALLRSLVVGDAISGSDVEALHEAVREHHHFTSGSGHWVTDRTVATNVEWSMLARDLRRAAEDLNEMSWYEPAAVISRIVDLYRSTRTESIYRRAEDGQAVRDLVAPAIEAGFADQTSRLHLLAVHVKTLEDRDAAGTATDQERQELAIAAELLEEARTAPEVLLPKPDAGRSAGLSATSEQPAEPREKIIRNLTTQQLLARETTGSVSGDLILDRLYQGFSASAAYTGEAREAVDQVAHILTTFLFSRDSLGPSEVPYLFDEAALEKDLAADLEQFIKQSGQFGDVRTEVRHVAGGRVDIEFAYPGFNLYVELKVDSTAVPLGDKVSYLKQSASYETQGPPLGFLMALRILAPKTVPPLLVNCVEVVDVEDAEGQVRRVATFDVSGNRTAPSGQ